MIEIKPKKISESAVTVPGSKSYTHRALIASALSDGVCKIHNILQSEDTLLTLNALKQLGVKIELNDGICIVNGLNGKFLPCNKPIYLGNSGTSMRLLTTVTALGNGSYTLTGTKRMCERPIQDLIDALRQIGVDIKSNGCPPVEIKGSAIKGGSISLNCEISSQYLSALLLIAPHTEKGLNITIVKGPVSKPYIDMTVDIMQKFGIDVKREGYKRFFVQGKQIYKAGTRFVEPDCSQASYFWAAAAITGATIKVKGIDKNSRQGDVRFVKLLEKMGCNIAYESDGIKVTGNPLLAIEADMADMPDMVPTLAVVAAFAKGATIIKNVAHLKAKESNRLTSVANELIKMGIKTECTDSGLIIQGGKPHKAEIDTYNDHRIAMSFALIGLVVPNVFIKNEKCVEKSFPNFWNVFEGLNTK